jgi:AcrR family transcriptional regulator
MRAYRPITDRRRRFLKAALANGERDGVGTVSVRRVAAEVAAEAGVSLRLVSCCFASKKELPIVTVSWARELDDSEAALARLGDNAELLTTMPT